MSKLEVKLLTDKSKPQKGDVLITKDGTLGRVALVGDETICINQSVAVVRPNQRIVPLYLSYLLQAPPYQKKMLEDAGGSTIKHIYITIVNLMPIAVPPSLDEQRAIADALSEVDAEIAALDDLIAKKRDLKQGAMQRLLTGEERLPGFERTLSYKHTEMGVIPEDWNITTLKALCEFENGDRGQNYPSKKDFVQTGLPFINAGHISNGYIDQSELDYISREKFEKLGGGKIATGDILFCLRGSLGKFGVVPPGFGDGAIASSLVIIRPKSERVLRKYLINYFASAYCTQMIEQWSGGAAQPNLGARDLARFTVPLPTNIAEQKAIATVLSDMDAEITVLEAQRDKTVALKQGMMQDLLTGKVRLV